MFQFTTTTIINSNEDFVSKVTPLFEGQQSGEGGPKYNQLVVKRHLTFKQPYVKAIYRRKHNEGELAAVLVNFNGITVEPGLYRLAIYIRLEGSANEYYANDFVFKGKPIFIEFMVKNTDDPEAITARIEKIAKKYMQTVYEYPLIKITAGTGNDGELEQGVLGIWATDEYQRFFNVEVLQYTTDAGLPTGCCGVNSGEFVTVDKLNTETSEEATPNSEGFTIPDGPGLGNINFIGLVTTPVLKPGIVPTDGVVTGISSDDDDNIVSLAEGKCGFGTYRQIIKDLRLPTADNRRWGGIIQDEVPIPGATYDQYTIYYCRKVGVQGLAHVGDVVTSLTCHIFYVNTNLTTAWNNALQALGVAVTDVPPYGYTTSSSLDDLEIEAQSAAASQTTTNTTNVGKLAAAIGKIATESSITGDEITAIQGLIPQTEG